MFLGSMVVLSVELGTLVVLVLLGSVAVIGDLLVSMVILVV